MSVLKGLWQVLFFLFSILVIVSSYYEYGPHGTWTGFLSMFFIWVPVTVLFRIEKLLSDKTNVKV